jgi:hypothetical protein
MLIKKTHKINTVELIGYKDTRFQANNSKTEYTRQMTNRKG